LFFNKSLPGSPYWALSTPHNGEGIDMARLQKLGYVHVLSDGQGSDRRRRYDVSGLYVALAICIAVDPTSKWAKSHGGPVSVARTQRLSHSIPGSKARVWFNLDFDALEELVHRSAVELTYDEDE
jgi:hypothetical protein